ncbi:MAG: hypothetical protein VW268_09065 [Rhodospirillaceae bacterium]
MLAALVALPRPVGAANDAIRTENLQYDAKGLTMHVAEMVAGDSKQPLMKWEPGPVRYFVFGIKEPFLGAFRAVMDDHARRLGITFEQSPAPQASQFLFFYLKDLGDMLNIPNLAQFFGGNAASDQAAFR